jgi:hypothetical protein
MQFERSLVLLQKGERQFGRVSIRREIGYKLPLPLHAKRALPNGPLSVTKCRLGHACQIRRASGKFQHWRAFMVKAAVAAKCQHRL